MRWSLRPASKDDLAALVSLEQEAFGTGAWGEPLLASELVWSPYLRHVVIAETDDGAACGYASLLVVDDVGEIQRIAVAAGARRCGIGRELVTELVGAAATRGCREVMLEVGVDNEAALGLYESLGFTEVRRRPRYFDAGRFDALVLRHPL